MTFIQNCRTAEQLAHHKFKRSIFIAVSAENVARQLATTGRIVPNKPIRYTLANKQRLTKKGEFNDARDTTLVCLGIYKLTPSSPMKGHPGSVVRGARSQFVRSLQERCDMILVDEHNTTKACSICHKPMEILNHQSVLHNVCTCVDGKRRVRDNM